ncbi:unnamed protein product, partial [Mesorhabditis belari]|uniref:Uncharacterized protein n=1 Tax=Mesorhabditis belari TaxID=2138241 RepID=A0AAF3F913_9BILA
MVADGVAPYLLFPMIGGVPYGWISYLGVPTSILTFITIAIIVTLLTAFSSCYDSTCTHVTIVHVLMLRWYMYSCFDSTCTQVYPYFKQYIMLSDFYAFTPSMGRFVLLNVIGYQLFNLFSMTFLATLSFESLRIQEKFIGKSSMDKERKLIKALIIQVSIPMFTIVIPFNIGAIVYFLDDVQLTSEITV